jgi:hypothetical protein
MINRSLRLISQSLLHLMHRWGSHCGEKDRAIRSFDDRGCVLLYRAFLPRFQAPRRASRIPAVYLLPPLISSLLYPLVRICCHMLPRRRLTTLLALASDAAVRSVATRRDATRRAAEIFQAFCSRLGGSLAEIASIRGHKQPLDPADPP